MTENERSSCSTACLKAMPSKIIYDRQEKGSTRYTATKEPIALSLCCSYRLEVPREVEQLGPTTATISMMSFGSQPTNLMDIYAGDKESRKLVGVDSSEL